MLVLKMCLIRTVHPHLYCTFLLVLHIVYTALFRLVPWLNIYSGSYFFMLLPATSFHNQTFVFVGGVLNFFRFLLLGYEIFHKNILNSSAPVCNILNDCSLNCRWLLSQNIAHFSTSKSPRFIDIWIKLQKSKWEEMFNIWENFVPSDFLYNFWLG